MKTVNIILKVILCLILALPVAGATGVMGEATRELYNTDQAFAFIQMLTDTAYIPYINAVIFATAIVLIVMGRMALAALLILPITVNVVAFHLFLDGGLFTGGALLGNIMLALNAYFLWQNRERYMGLWDKDGASRPNPLMPAHEPA